MQDRKFPTSKGCFLYILRNLYATHLLPTLPFLIPHGEYGVEVVCRTDSGDMDRLKRQLHGTVRLVPQQIAQADQPQRRIDDFAAEKFESFIVIAEQKAVV
jgi:hypothetical protein